MTLRTYIAALLQALDDDDVPSLLDGSEWTGDMNFRRHRFDWGTDAAGYYEDDV